MLQKVFFIFLLVYGMFASLNAQEKIVSREELSSSLEKSFQNATQLIRKMEFPKAEASLIKILKKEPLFLEGKKELGLLYFRQKRYSEAIEQLQFVADHDIETPNSILFSLATCLWHSDDFRKASIVLERLLQSNITSEKMKAEASKLYRDAQFSKSHFVVEGQDTGIEKLGPNINTDWPEYLPVITAEGNMLIFTRRNKGREDFYFSKKEETGEWSQARPLTELNSPNNEGAICISSDGKTIIFTICNDPRGFGSCDLYQSELFRGRWTPPRNLGGTINTQYKETQPSLSPDGRTLYFVSDRPGGLGGHDIWTTEKDKKGEWQSPVNLGAPINTTEDELTPFFHFDGESLFFASSGHPGLGALDLFKSTLLPDHTWSVPQNLGSPINTKVDESSLSVHLSGNKAFMARESKDESGNFSMNIYQVTLPPWIAAKPSSFIKLKITDSESDQPLRAVVEIAGGSNESNKTLYQADREGELLICLPNDYAYSLTVYHPGYLLNSERFDLINALESLHEQELTIKLTSIPSSDILVQRDTILDAKVLKNVFFESGSAELLPTSTFELQQLSAWMKAHPEVRVLIGGHTDDVGSKSANETLSKARSEAVKGYLIGTGIAMDRVETKGYGSTAPIAPNTSEEGRALNRRTTFEIIP